MPHFTTSSSQMALKAASSNSSRLLRVEDGSVVLVDDGSVADFDLTLGPYNGNDDDEDYQPEDADEGFEQCHQDEDRNDSLKAGDEACSTGGWRFFSRSIPCEVGIFFNF
jgi:hypothetical protein